MSIAARDIAVGLGGIGGICAYALVRDGPPRRAAAIAAAATLAVGVPIYETVKDGKGHVAELLLSGGKWVASHPFSGIAVWALVSGGFNLAWDYLFKDIVAPFLYIAGVTNINAVPIVLTLAAAVATVAYGSAMGWPIDTLRWVLRGFKPDPLLLQYALPGMYSVVIGQDGNGEYAWNPIAAEDSVPPFYANDSEQNSRHEWGMYMVLWDALRAVLAVPIKAFDALKAIDMSDISGSIARIVLIPVDASLYAVTMANNAVVDVLIYGAHISRVSGTASTLKAVLDFGLRQPGPIFQFQSANNASPYTNYMVIPE